MKKQLNTNGVLNELRSGSRFFTASPEVPSPLQPESQVSNDPSVDPSTDGSIDQLTGQLAKQSTTQVIPQATEQPISESIAPLMRQPIDRSPILGRPKAFYITEQQDRDLDLAVGKLGLHTAEKIGQKIDRSTVLRLLLEGADLTNDQTIERLVNQLVSRLISQLTGR